MLVSVLLSAFVHAGVLQRVAARRSAPRASSSTAVVIAPLSTSAWDANRRVTAGDVVLPRLPSRAPDDARSPQIDPRVAEPSPPPERVAGQVVDLAPTPSSPPPHETRFLAEHDSRVEKETRSRHASARHERPAPRPAASVTLAPTPIDAPEAEVASEDAPSASPMARPGAPVDGSPDPGAASDRVSAASSSTASHAKLGASEREPAAGDSPVNATDPGVRRPGASSELLALRLDERGERAPAGAPAGGGTPGSGRSTRSGSPGAGGGGEDASGPASIALPAAPGRLQLRPTSATLDRIAGGPAPDHLEGVEEGEATYLNARGWKYAGYFDRISRAVRGYWDPNLALRSRDPHGVQFGGRDRSTVLTVKLDDHGSLRDVAVQRSSGLEFLDAAAIQALRRAQPFENPPRGLANERGEIVFSYGFTVQARTLDRLLFRNARE